MQQNNNKLKKLTKKGFVTKSLYYILLLSSKAIL